jgi:hypothetical protein
MLKPTRIWGGFVVVLAALAGCGGNDRDSERAEKAIEGTFVGKVTGTNAFLAVVASPAARGKDQREVTVYVSDGKRFSERFAGSARSNIFTANADDGDAEAKGKLSGGSATGTLELPDGKTVRYQATQATATSGLYDLTVSARGKISGASAAGVGLTSEAGLRAPGEGTLKFADGKRRRFDITGAGTGDPTALRAGQIRLIVLPDGAMTGAGESRSKEFFIRSAG